MRKDAGQAGMKKKKKNADTKPRSFGLLRQPDKMKKEGL